MSGKIFLLAGSALAGLSVLLGAFGAHGLKGRVSETMLAVFQTGVQYQMYHALALLAVGVLMQKNFSLLLGYSGWLFIVGIFLFSGSLYVLALSSIRWVGPVTPLGGVALIVGWILMFVAIYRNGI